MLSSNSFLIHAKKAMLLNCHNTSQVSAPNSRILTSPMTRMATRKLRIAKSTTSLATT
jgi:hypothetical protein